jgi:hypothetical protein
MVVLRLIPVDPPIIFSFTNTAGVKATRRCKSSSRGSSDTLFHWNEIVMSGRVGQRFCDEHSDLERSKTCGLDVCLNFDEEGSVHENRYDCYRDPTTLTEGADL